MTKSASYVPKEAAVPSAVETRDLKMHFASSQGFMASLLGQEPEVVRAVDGVSFTINAGETLGLAGESGSGKTTTAKCLLRLYRPTSGTILFESDNIANLDRAYLKDFRRKAQMIFQDPYESLNPRFSVRTVVEEPLIIHGIGNSAEREARVEETLKLVGLLPPGRYLKRFPHQLSGGERQRVAIARAMVLRPRLIVADEPVSMLDVSIRAGILNLLTELIEEMNLAGMYIAHDLSLIRYMCDRTAIMYLGRMVEIGPTEELIEEPLHPYAQALLRAVPVPDVDQGKPMIPLSGEIPSAKDIPRGCRFHTRCLFAVDLCRRVDPNPRQVGDRTVECHLYEPGEATSSVTSPDGAAARLKRAEDRLAATTSEAM